MDQDNPNQSKTREGNPNNEAEASATVSASDPTTPAQDPSACQPPGPPRPRRPQRSARVEGSVDISELKAEPTPPTSQSETSADGAAASRPKPSRPASLKPAGEHARPSGKVGPKVPGHHPPHPVRAASVPQPLASRPIPPHLNPHAQRALSVAGTADTEPQTVEDFRLVSCSCCLTTHSQNIHIISVTISTCLLFQNISKLFHARLN